VFALPDAGIGRPGPVRAPINPSAEPIRVDPAPAGDEVAASDGKAVYEKNCAACHGAGLEGAGEAPALKGAPFLANWKSKTANQLFAFVRQNMPPGGAGSLSDIDYRAVTAYILQANGTNAGGQGH